MSTWIHRTARWLWVLIFAVSTPAFANDTVNWTEDAVLHDGRTLALRVQGHNASPSFYNAYQNSTLNQFTLTFAHPDTQETIVWQGAPYFSPVLIDVLGGVPYLVLYGRPTHDTAGQYGCPELPYIYLRYAASAWQAVPVDQAPAELVQANLSIHGMPTNAAGRHFSRDDIAQNIQASERQSSGLLQAKIPRTVAEWKTDQKRSALYDRMVGDCRPPHPTQQPIALPAATNSVLGVLEINDYVPEKEYDAPEWNALVTDPQRAAACKNVLRRVELANFTQDLRFTQDTTASKRVPYARDGVLDAGVQMLSDDHVWFITAPDAANTLTVTQYTPTGDLVFRTALVPPRDEPGLTGALRLPSLRYEGGYLYIDWLHYRNAGKQWLVKRVLNLRAPVAPRAP